MTPKKDSLAATVTEVLTDSQGRLVAILDNDQMWRMTEVNRGVLWRENDRIVVTRGVFNSFFLEVEGTNRRVRAKRVR